jgi:predicted SnoaL-like aldol condensation-catalyzing enzyme
MSGADPRQVTLDAYFDGINEERFDDVGALFTADGELHAPGFPVRRGPEEIAAYLAGVLATYPIHRDQPTRTLIAGDTATVEIHYTGKLADGTPLEFEAVDIFDFTPDARIASLRTWYDSAAVLGDLAKAAAVPGPDADAVAAAGSAAEATPARVRAALRAVRDGRGVRIAGSWREATGESPLVARALILDLTGTAEVDADVIAAAASAAGVEVRPGDVLLLRTGAAEVTLGALPPGVAAVALNARVTSIPEGLMVVEGWDFGGAFDALGPGRRPIGLLVAPVASNGAVLLL